MTHHTRRRGHPRSYLSILGLTALSRATHLREVQAFLAGAWRPTDWSHRHQTSGPSEDSHSPTEELWLEPVDHRERCPILPPERSWQEDLPSPSHCYRLLLLPDPTGWSSLSSPLVPLWVWEHLKVDDITVRTAGQCSRLTSPAGSVPVIKLSSRSRSVSSRSRQSLLFPASAVTSTASSARLGQSRGSSCRVPE